MSDGEALYRTDFDTILWMSCVRRRHLFKAEAKRSLTLIRWSRKNPDVLVRDPRAPGYWNPYINFNESFQRCPAKETIPLETKNLKQLLEERRAEWKNRVELEKKLNGAPVSTEFAIASRPGILVRLRG